MTFTATRTPTTTHLRGQLQPTTQSGRRFVDVTESALDALAEAAPAHDLDGSFPSTSLEHLVELGIPWAPAPESVGGLGVDSIFDLVVGMSRLARADPALTIGVNMHLIVVAGLAHATRVASWKGDADEEAAGLSRLEALTGFRVLVASAYSEPGQHLQQPATRAVRSCDGWRIDGRKFFSTMAVAADVVAVASTYTADDGSDRIAFVQVPTTAPGLTIVDDWDALGMRASGSNSLVLDGVHVPDDALTDIAPAGRHSVGLLGRFLPAGLFHAAAMVGVAESAHARSIEPGAALTERARSAMSVAENVVDLTTMRSLLGSAATDLDRHLHAAEHGTEHSFEEVADLFARLQAAKAEIDRAAIRVVDRAIELSGGRGYMASSPLSKAWRDVRAGALMHPIGANRVFDLIAAVELGLDMPLG